MKTLNSAQARKDISKIQKEIIQNHEPIVIIGEAGNTVMVSEEDWNAIQETLFLLSIPEMRDSVTKGMKQPLEECIDVEELGWDIE